MAPAFLVPDWPVPAAVRAAFTLRTGGVSRASFASLNLGLHVGDEPAAVIENRRRLGEALKLPAPPAWLEQQHGTDVRDLDAPSRLWSADAAITRTRGRVCAVQVADCLPVLLAAKDASVVGAAHCGWRGLSQGVLEAAVRAMGVAGGTLCAWLGPAIGARSFEVGAEVRAAFVDHDAGAAAAFIVNERGRWQCDLYELARQRLAALGVASVCGGGLCTFADPQRFFSFRRDARCGRMAALVWLADAGEAQG